VPRRCSSPSRTSRRSRSRADVLAGWYDVFSHFYDGALEALYAPYRARAVGALRLSPGARVLDLPCGTGQSLDALVAAVGADGAVVGVDLSAGMLKRARRRVERAGWRNVTLHRARAADVDAGLVGAPVDGVLCALGLTALPDWEATFEALFTLLAPGGRFVVLDVHAPARTIQARSVELVARADLSRRAWEPLQARCDDFVRERLPADEKKLGGELYVAVGTRR
jgi:ubiquinone/menaquinone biosynthesis C-methylase UbiE